MTKNQEILCFIDWLGLSVRVLGDPKPLPGYQWREYTATNVWGKRRVLWTESGDRVLTLLTEPRSSILGSKCGLVEIENEWLYHGGGAEKILATLLKSVPYEITGISRLDLCADFVPDAAQREVILGLGAGAYYVAGKRSGSGFWSTNKAECLHRSWRGFPIPHSQSWGHKTSDVKWKLYYKTRELWEAGGWVFPHKPYIIDQWRLAGFDESNVWRLEVSLKHLNGMMFQGEVFDLHQLTNCRGEFFINFFNKRFIVKENQGHADKTNDTVIHFLPLPYLNSPVTSTPPKSLAKHSGRITLLRHLVQSLDDEHILLDAPTRMAVFNHIQQVIDRDHLDNYFHAMTGKWPDEFFADKDSEAAEGLTADRGDMYALSMEKGGSASPQDLHEVPDWRQKYQFSPNIAFDTCAGESLTWELSEAAQRRENELQQRVDELAKGFHQDDGDFQVSLEFDSPSC